VLLKASPILSQTLKIVPHVHHTETITIKITAPILATTVKIINKTQIIETAVPILVTAVQIPVIAVRIPATAALITKTAVQIRETAAQIPATGKATTVHMTAPVTVGIIIKTLALILLTAVIQTNLITAAQILMTADRPTAHPQIIGPIPPRIGPLITSIMIAVMTALPHEKNRIIAQTIITAIIEIGQILQRITPV